MQKTIYKLVAMLEGVLDTLSTIEKAMACPKSKSVVRKKTRVKAKT